MTIHLQSTVAPQLELNKNFEAVAKGLEPMLIPVESSIDHQQAKEDHHHTAPTPPASKDNAPTPATDRATVWATPITTHLPPCNPPNIFTSTPHSKLTARRFLAQCQLVFDYSDASANQAPGPFTDEQKILYAASFMRADAGDWVNGWKSNTEGKLKTWDHFKMVVLRRFKIKAASHSKNRDSDRI